MSDNAAVRKNYASDIYQCGVDVVKNNIINAIPNEYAELHRNGYIHIHDAEAYGKVNNCSMPDLIMFFNGISIKAKTDQGKISEIINFIKNLITNLALSQSGGIGFANFDSDLSYLLNKNAIEFNQNNICFYSDCIRDFLTWINTTKTRYCREAYYLTFNIGLSVSEWGKKTAEILITEFYQMPIGYTRPNIVFKVNQKVNSVAGTVNFRNYTLALKCTALRMIPTYLLTDSDVNKKCIPEKIGIMGCRTRVYNNINGHETSIGRGNIANVSINLPRIALESLSIDDFFLNLERIMNKTSELLIKRAQAFKNADKSYLYFPLKNNIWSYVDNVDEMLKQGTLSIGFIGLSETVETLTGNKYYNNIYAYGLAKKIVEFMRNFTDQMRTNNKMNFSLLATPGEMISGRFCNIDREIYDADIHKKGFYTNSFHIPVDSGVPLLKKIELEAPFHKLCNGGCITYIEFQSAPLTNILSLNDAIHYAEEKGISYLGFNYPLDICNDCKNVGTFDICPQCGKKNIKRIRRVSGYLEDLNFFTDGKKAEESNRKPNA